MNGILATDSVTKAAKRAEKEKTSQSRGARVGEEKSTTEVFPKNALGESYTVELR